MYSKTFELTKRLLKKLSKERRTSLLITNCNSYRFNRFICSCTCFSSIHCCSWKENTPPIPFSNFITTDPIVKSLLLIIAYIVLNWFASFSRILLRAKQERLRASVFLDLSNIVQRNVLTQNYEFFLSEKSEDLTSKILLNISRVSEKLISQYFK